MLRPTGKLKTTLLGSYTQPNLKITKKFMDKFIVIDGVKYQIDPNDNTKALLGADGKPVLFKEEEGNKVDLSKFSLDDLKKANPDVAKALQDLETLQGEKTQAQKDAEEADRKAKADAGKWQEIADDEKKKREALEGDFNKNKEVLEKYKGTVTSILDSTLKDVPADKLALIPKDYSPRKKLEYITNNAKILGINISPANKGGKIPDNELEVNLDEESKATKEYDELLKKGKERTPIETNKMMELARKIKEIRIANTNKK